VSEQNRVDLSESVAAVLRANPDGNAIEFRGQWFKWRYIARVADSIEGALKQAGVAADMPLGLVARNRPGQVSALLSCLLARRVFVMIYAAQSPQRIAEEVSTLRLAAIVADAQDWSPELTAAARSLGSVGLSLGLDADNPVQGVPGLERLGSGEYRRQPAGISAELLSSGTTGRPKRIPCKTETLERAAFDARSVYATGRTDGFQIPGIMLHPLGNISGFTYLIPLATFGQPLVLMEKFSLADWLEAVKKYHPPRPALPPTALQMVLDANVPKDALEGVIAIGTGGQRLKPEVQEEFEKRYGIMIMQAYGATEFGGVICYWTHDLYREFGARKRESVGRPRAGVQLRVVDPETRADLPAGSVGVVEAKVDRVGPDWIVTTDLGSFDSDGFFYLHGRYDQAINRGGFKIVPEIVATALRAHPAVADVAVMARPDDRLGEVPVAALELRPGTVVKDGELESFAREKLVAYQVPTEFRIFDALPRNDSMKIDLPRLKAMMGLAPVAPVRA
jgi:acyl-CoA synthetase (AMP-forming)/AMP-acid ligase II